jgi:hypothetical protein
MNVVRFPYGVSRRVHSRKPRRDQQWTGRSRHKSLDQYRFKRDTFRIVLPEPFIRGLLAGEELQVIGITDLLASVDISPHGCGRYAHRSSRRPLNNGCRTLPSADLARYSISASNSGSTQMPL